MEQRSEHQYMPLTGAATDPAYVPGLVPPRASAPEELLSGAASEADGAGRANEDAADPGAAEPDTGGEARPGDADAQAGTEAGADTAAEAAAESDADTDGDAGTGERPACEMSDRQGSIVADHRGIRLRLRDEEADFRWDEVSAVEYRTPRWSRRFHIAVYTPAPRRFSHDVDAADRAELARWGEHLEAVLDAYFEN
ncbi:hypothetical protein ABZX93_00490 [Streptomyces sp. NPDC006632]|uniref:hypothetical protein n=1 Tax=Streptomyces sp. NPDC006632 TaxID=3157182 RepID=UPI0033B120E5